MSERGSYAPGAPCWVDLATPDVEASERFYGPLFGWEIPELPNSAQMGGYRRAKLNGKDIAGVYPFMEDGQHPAWATYFSVTDAAATAARVKENGGAVIVEPMDIGIGHMGVFSDPAGGIFGVWQPGGFAGSELTGEPGSVVWNELNTRDVEGAKRFYGAVFDWTFAVEEHDEVTYVVVKLGEQMIGGIFDITGVLPDEVPQNWLVYFGAEDVDAAAQIAKDSGGQLPSPPHEMPGGGRFAVLMDPAGAVFGVMAMGGEHPAA